jgi:hypothetical protein
MFWTRSVLVRSRSQSLPPCRFFSSKSLPGWYSKKLDTHPYLTKGIASGMISLTGDVTCQYLTRKEDGKFDFARTFRFFLMGAVLVAPITNFWYTALSTRIIPGPRTVANIVKRLVVDQFIFAPIFVNAFMGCLWMLEGKSDIPQTLVEVAPEMIVANWLLWIPAMTINFGFVPLKYQVLFGNTVELVWNVYLSNMSLVDERKA